MVSTPEPIAIVGAGCRFPGGASRPSKLWELLKSPQDVATPIPKERFSLDAFYHSSGPHHGTTNVKESYFMSDVNALHFDAAFFNMAPSEADPMDPQHRHLLEVVYEAMEDAGLMIEELQGSNTSVFVGLMCTDYYGMASRDLDAIPTYGATGVAASNASSRISYFFDWHGACMTIDTACSSSLVALHQAVNNLRSGSSKVSVVAGTNLLLDPLPYISESNLNMLSPTGRSRMWDASADGYARGDGVAAVILKTLSQAIRDGDQIDCIIRETGANQDGRTKGITMPSGMAQAELIRDTYNRAGLNPLNPLERCQYFEAHGTGTPAGDPQEASALDAAFFDEKERDDILYVGSVKTVIGHTEGTAGLAGVLKAYNAIKNKTIPPNLHFNELSPAVKPYYKHLQIVKEAIPWPELPAGVPRRASVNSFGFGGSNAHAILESYEKKVGGNHPSLSLIPFVFSANSEASLQALLESYADYIKANPSLNLDSLRYMLANKRSALSHRTFFVAPAAEELASQIENRLRVCRETNEPVGLKPQGASEIIAIFTGQGAQWAGMGKEFVKTFPPARQLIKNLDDSLAALPKSDRPKWSIYTELTEPTMPNQINEAYLSQPLCTAIQIVLVDLLRSTGTKFKAVVGHSSGEIAAAFAAGFISASDAIRIAYYRGLHAKLSRGPKGEKGAMMAVGTSFEDAKEVCELEGFENRIHVAAVNSSSSVTLSGDEEILEQAKEVFQKEKKFTRVLKVDTAYHSHHMLPCAEAYTKSLKACNIQVLTPNEDAPVWISSVREAEDMGVTKDLASQYWVDNMVSPVLFYQALEHALKSKGTFTLGLEVGPHPALQGPAMQTMQETVDTVIPYSGTFYRSKANDVAVADALGASWTGPGSTGSNWIKFVEECWGDMKTIPVLKDLPTYPWDHSRLFRSESRYAKHLRTQPSPVHPLLGQKTADGTGESIIRWKNILKPKEIQWLSGHALQGQLVFPGTGYIGLAMEASMEIAAGRPVESIELLDLAITKAIAVDEMGTEIVVSMTEINGHLENDPKVITAHFTSFSSISRESVDLQVNAFGNVRINMGTSAHSALLPREDRNLEMTPVDIDEFYSAMGDLGYGYAGEFKALSKIERRLGYARGTISRPPIDENERTLLFHPGMLDTALQTLFAAFSAPGDERLWALHAPSGIRRVTLVPSLCGKNFPEQVEFDSMITASRPNHITGDVDIISADGSHKCIEIDGLGFVPFTAATEADDRKLFSKVTWGLEDPDGALAIGRSEATDAENQKSLERERVAFFYLRKIYEGRPSSVDDYQAALLEFARHMEDQVRKGKHPYAPKAWLSDTREQILELIKKRGHDADLNLLHAVGENMPAILRKEITTLEVMTVDNMLDEYYEGAQGFQPVNVAIAAMLGQITLRYPHANILEIGAGTGGATKGILQTLKTAFTSYTYTDISPGFFGKARQTFKEYADRMVFKTLDVTKDPIEQGYTENAYDIIIASNVLHATPYLEETMANTRRLLKPGGFLVMLEIVKIDTMAVGLTMGGLPGWWIGRNDGRIHSPTITIPQWDTVLKNTGFSGVETSTPDIGHPFIASVFVSRAVSPQFDLVRNPLSSKEVILGDVVVVGGNTNKTATQVDYLQSLLKPRSTSLTIVSTLEELVHHELAYGSTVLSLADLDAPVLENLTEERWTVLQKLLPQARNVLWVTSGYIDEQPYAGAIVGLHRCTAAEIPELRLQLLEVDVLDKSSATLLVEQLLRSKIIAQSQEGEEVLYSLEPELMLQDGKLKFYRAMPDTDANNRYNSSKRRITKDVDPQVSSVELEWVEPTESFALREEKDLAARAGLLNIRVSHSSLSSILTAGGLAHVGVGENIKTGKPVLFLANKNTSIAAVPPTSAVELTGAVIEKAGLLKLAVAYLISRQIASHLHAGATAIVHEPDVLLAQILRDQTQGTGVKLVFTTAVEGEHGPDWITLHSRMARRHLANALPANADFLVDLSYGGGDLGSRITGALPSRCKHIELYDLLSKDASLVGGGVVIRELLKDTAAFVAEQARNFSPESPLELFSLVDVASNGGQKGPFAIIDWTHDPTVPTGLEPVDFRQDLFKADRTYWMVGLAGDLGQSISDWMIDHGARNIVLTSRSNKVSEKWIKACSAKGATVAFVPGDITSASSMRNTHTEISKRFPPIGGVANGALILRDKLFVNTTFEDINAVMSPKTTGTVILDQLFPDNTLDWFIAFSSVVATSGNTGQCAYSAANMFMKTIVNDRRKRGLAAASIDISRVHGVGYVERNALSLGLSKKEMDKIQRFALSMSETDLHQLFAEAVIASRPDSGRHSDLITGIRTLSSRDVADVFWAASLRFSHFVNDVEPAGEGTDENRQARIVVKTQLKSAKSPDDVVAIIKAAFTAKLTASLEHDESNALPDSTPLIDFGMDSLVAVEIRSWFLQELEVEVPVLRIMGGATISDLVADAVEKLPAEISLVGAEAGGESEKPAANGTANGSAVANGAPKANGTK